MYKGIFNLVFFLLNGINICIMGNLNYYYTEYKSQMKYFSNIYEKDKVSNSNKNFRKHPTQNFELLPNNFLASLKITCIVKVIIFIAEFLLFKLFRTSSCKAAAASPLGTNKEFLIG